VGYVERPCLKKKKKKELCQSKFRSRWAPLSNPLDETARKERKIGRRGKG
jgi:hypothetical protein